MTLHVTLTGGEAARARLSSIPGALERAVALTAQDAFNFVADRLADHFQTGDLARSLDIHRQDPFSYLIRHDLQVAPHAVFVHWGTRPHEIRPKNKKALRWVSGAHFVFSARVQHPGYAGDPWMVDTASQVPAMFARRVNEQLEKV